MLGQENRTRGLKPPFGCRHESFLFASDSWEVVSDVQLKLARFLQALGVTLVQFIFFFFSHFKLNLSRKKSQLDATTTFIPFHTFTIGAAQCNHSLLLVATQQMGVHCFAQGHFDSSEGE